LENAAACAANKQQGLAKEIVFDFQKPAPGAWDVEQISR